MADNMTVKNATGAAITVSTKEVGGVHHAKQLLQYLISGVPTIVDASNPLPVGGSMGITGDVFARQQGAWTFQLGNTPNTNPILASIHDGTNKATVRSLPNAKALNVALVNSNGDLTSNGTEYSDGAAAGTPIGTQLNWNNAGVQASTSLLKPLPVQPGTNIIFPITSPGVIPLPISLTNSTSAYLDGYIVGGLLTFTNASRANGLPTRLKGLKIYDKTGQNIPMDLFIFNTTLGGTTPPYTTLFGLNDSDSDRLITRVSLIDYASTGTGKSFCNVGSMEEICIPASGSRNLYGILVARAGVTWANASALYIRAIFDQD